MAENCNCGCPDCTCNEDSQELNYSVREMNDILADGIINASVRYTRCKGTYIPLTLADALALVPDKDKQVTKIITFMNKDEDPKPEIWIFKGKSIMDWLNPTAWVNVPLPSVSGLNQYITSVSVRGVEVTEKAPLQKDDVIYFEYEPLPQYSEYGFEVSMESQPQENIPVVANVTLATTYIGENGLKRVKVLFGVNSKPTDSHVKASATDSLGITHEFVDQGYWGPPAGFDISAEYAETTPFTLTFTKSGNYQLYYKLIEVSTGKAVVESTLDVTVN